MPRQPSPAARVVFLVVKFVAIVVGFVGSLVSAMSMTGAVIEAGWLRLLIALIVLLLPPMVLADRLLPADNATPAPGVVSDVFSVMWLGIAMAWSLGWTSVSKPLLAREGDRLAAAGYGQLAEVAYLLGAVDVKAPGEAGGVVGAGSASAAASGAASAPPGAPGASASAAVAGSASASASGAASAPPLAASAPLGARMERPDAGPGEKSPSELFKELAPSVVTLFVKGEHESSGTGFLIDDQGTIATNHHVIDGGKALTVKFQNGAQFTSAELLADASAVDLALLRVDLSQPADAGPGVVARALRLGDSDAVVVGERALSIGNPLGLDHTLTDGLVSARRVYDNRPWIQMSVPVSPGNSGGPLFNMRGEVIGITTQQVLGGMFGRAQNLNLAVPVNELKKMIAPSYPSKRPFGQPGSRGGHW